MTNCFQKKYSDIVVIVVSLGLIIGGGFLFANGHAKSQAAVIERDNCDRLRMTEFVNNKNHKDLLSAADEFNHQEACKEAADALDSMTIINWLGSFLCLCAGIVGLVYIGHRFTHELKHANEPTI